MEATPERWTIHDLRRTCASHMAALGVTLPTVSLCLNHWEEGGIGGLKEIYIVHDQLARPRPRLKLGP